MQSKSEKDYLSTSPIAGLTKEEARERLSDGLGNNPSKKSEKGFWSIFKHNVCNFFTLFLFGIAILFAVFYLLLRNTGYSEEASRYFGFSKFGYLIPLVFNIVIGIYTEMHSKKVLDKMKIVNQAKIIVIRDGEKLSITSKEVVLGDILVISSGEQIVVDAKLMEGDIEVDESLLTGESTAVRKSVKGAELYSGSFVVSGAGKALVTAVGESTYANSLSKKVKAIQSEKSQLMKTIYGILNVLSFVLLGVVATVIVTMCVKIALHGDDPSVFPNAMSLSDPVGWAQIVSTASAFAIGVIPTGLVLCTSLSLGVSIVNLSKKKTLIQELYSLENLSRVDVLCLDKTGTLTDGTMRVVKTDYFGSKEDADSFLGALLWNTKSFNATSNALKEVFPPVEMRIREMIPFSSQRKFSGIVLKSGKEVLLGAPEFICSSFKDVLEKASEAQKRGLRVVALVYDGTPLALYSIEDKIRPSAKQTIAYFYENDVDVKIISGDSPITVSKIAESCGVRSADKAVSLEGKSLEETKELAESYVVFARVSPEQKEVLVSALQAKGHKVAMTGDGVNDTLALRKANSSVTFARATDAAKACSDVILMDNDFSHLVDVVLQGRRVVNNIQRSSILFLTKTFFIMSLCLFSIPFKAGQMLFTIENVYLFEQAVIGIGGFLLSLENSKKRIEGEFALKVFPAAIAGGLMLLIFALVPMGLWQCGVLTQENARASISFLTIIGGLVVMFALSCPFTKYRAIIFVISFFSAVLLALAAPNSYLGGQPTTLNMIFGTAFWHEFFQPWNSGVYERLEAQNWVIWIYLIVLLGAYPAYLGLRQLIKVIMKNAKLFEKPNA